MAEMGVQPVSKFILSLGFRLSINLKIDCIIRAPAKKRGRQYESRGSRTVLKEV
jgi:hypothetical protein